MRLYTFQISHFSEKARWGMDLSKIPYEEKRLLPGAHMITILRKAKRTHVPVLEDGATIIQGSSAILDRIEDAASLAVSEQDKAREVELEALTDKAFGRGTQTIFYGVLLQDRNTILDMWTQNGPSWGRAFYTLTFPLLKRAIKRSYRVNNKDVAKAIDRYKAAFDETDRLLGEKEFFFGDKLSRADISIASLLAPLVRPKEHSVKWPAASPELLDFVNNFEGRPTYKHVERTYANHRNKN